MYICKVEDAKHQFLKTYFKSLTHSSIQSGLFLSESVIHIWLQLHYVGSGFRFKISQALLLSQYNFRTFVKKENANDFENYLMKI